MTPELVTATTPVEAVGSLIEPDPAKMPLANVPVVVIVVFVLLTVELPKSPATGAL